MFSKCGWKRGKKTQTFGERTFFSLLLWRNGNFPIIIVREESCFNQVLTSVSLLKLLIHLSNMFIEAHSTKMSQSETQLNNRNVKFSIHNEISPVLPKLLGDYSKLSWNLSQKAVQMEVLIRTRNIVEEAFSFSSLIFQVCQLIN